MTSLQRTSYCMAMHGWFLKSFFFWWHGIMCWTLWATVVNRGLVGSLKFGNCTPCSSRKRLTGFRRLFSNEICVDYWDFRMYWNVFDASSKLERFRCIFLIFRYHTSEILFKNSNIWMDCTHCKCPQSKISYGVILVDVCVNQIKKNLAKKKVSHVYLKAVLFIAILCFNLSKISWQNFHGTLGFGHQWLVSFRSHACQYLRNIAAPHMALKNNSALCVQV